MHVWALGQSCEIPAAFAKCQEQLYNFSPHPWTSEKVNDQLSQILLVSRKKSLEHTEISREDALPPSGPTPLGPHFFWIVVCAVCAAPDSAACCCFSCCSCSCCGLLPLLLLLFSACFCCLYNCCCCFWAADCRTSFPTFAVFDLLKMSITFFTIDWNPFDLHHLEQNLLVSHRIPTGRRSSSPLHLSIWLSAFGPPCCCSCVKNSPLPLLTFQNIKNNFTID